MSLEKNIHDAPEPDGLESVESVFSKETKELHLRRPYFSQLAAFLVGGYLALIGAGCVPSQSSQSPQSCQNDYDCPDTQICENRQCIDSRSCNDDYNCPAEQICQDHQCLPPLSDPDQVFYGFTAALSRNSLKETLVYFEPAVREKYRQILSQKDLPGLSRQLAGNELSPLEEGKNFREYNFKVGDEEYPIQFSLLYRNGQEVWMIKNM